MAEDTSFAKTLTVMRLRLRQKENLHLKGRASGAPGLSGGGGEVGNQAERMADVEHGIRYLRECLA